MQADHHYAQALGLQDANVPRSLRVVAVTSGKGGVGKTNVSINLALGLAGLGRQVLLLDADLGLANVDVLLGLRALYNLSHVTSGERTLDEILIEGPGGMRIVPAASGIRAMAQLPPAAHANLIRAFGELSFRFDTLVVDTAAGISDSVLTFARASQEVIVVVCPEPASLADAYALIKVLSIDQGVRRFHVVCNLCNSPEDARSTFARLRAVTDRFLDVTLHDMGAIPRDDCLPKAVRRQQPVLDAYPGSPSAKALKELARIADKWSGPTGPSGHLEFLVERLIGLRQTEGGTSG